MPPWRRSTPAKCRRAASPSSCCTSFRNSFFGAFADGEVLPVLLLAVLCGFGLTRIGTAGRVVLDGIDGFAHMLFAAFGFIMRLAPLGAFGAMAFTVGRYGIKSIGSLGMLIGTFYVACIFFVVVVLGTAGADARVQAVAAAALHPRGAAGRARHVVERAGAAAPAHEAGAPGLQEGRRRAGAADRLLVQPRRHGDLPDARVDVHRPGLRHPRCRGPRSARCSA